ncbi:MAG: hydrogenase formation protein HypD [Actinomycetota bacterium]
MRFVDEYRDSDAARRLVDLLVRRVTRPWTVMEVCGGQTHTIVKYGVDQLVPSGVELVHGPGCPVCVTPLEMVDRALAIAADPRVIFCSFGDMLRVPGSSKDLLSVKAEGGDVRIVYSPMDCLRIARENPGKEIVFFAVGFETTAPANAMVARQAKRLGVTNLSLLVSHVLVPPAMDLILASPDNRVQGFLAAGHVCTVMGYAEYEPLARAHHVPIVVTGFEPLDVLQGLYMLLGLLEDGRVEVQNQYTRVVRREGNPSAKAMLSEVFEVTDRKWRGVGEIPRSGYRLRPEYAEFDAELRFDVGAIRVQESSLCRAGEVLRGLIKPNECEAFGVQCTPERPLGATMVSSEGACAAYYHYGRFREQVRTRT